MRNYILWGLAALFVVLVYACTKERIESAEKELLTFSIGEFKVNAEGIVNQETKSVTLQAVEGVDITKLAPMIKVSDKATVSPASGVLQDFTNPVTYTITAEDGSRQAYKVTVLPAKSSAKLISGFKFSKLKPEVVGVIDQEKKTILLKVPAGTNLKELEPEITFSDKAAVSPEKGVKQDFSKAVVYTVTAEDGSKQEYTVTVELAKRTGRQITGFKFASLNPVAEGNIDEEGKKIVISVAAGTDITSLVPTITLSEGATVSPSSEVKQDFSKAVVYTVTAENGTKQEYTVTVEPGKRSGKQITGFKFASLSPVVTGNIDEENKKIVVSVPAGTDITSLVPTITLSEGAKVSPSSEVKQDFSKAVVYTVTAEDGTKQEYTVTVELGKRSGRQITGFKFASLSPAVTGNIDEEGKKIVVSVPAGTDITSLVPTITLSEGAKVSPSSEVKQDFSKAVVYTVTAEDGTKQEYTVAVQAGKKSGKLITGFKLTSLNPVVAGKIDEEAKAISLLVSGGTDITTLVPTITLSDGATVSPLSEVKQDFSKAVVYTVTAEDGSTQEYKVSVEVVKRTNRQITGFKFASLNPAVTGSINEEAKAITLLVPTGTDVATLVPTITLSEGATVSPSSEVKQDFSKAVVYTVTAEDGSKQEYTVAVKVGKRTSRQITEFKFASLTPVATGKIDEEAKKIFISVPVNTDITSLAPTITLSEGAMVSPVSGEKRNFSSEQVYTVTSEDGNRQNYSVFVEVAKRSGKQITGFKLASLKPAVTGTINEESKTISMVVPAGTNITSLSPVISISAGAKVSPSSEVKQDFSKAVVYTVTAEDGSKQEYTVKIEAEKRTFKKILGFKFASLTPATSATIDEDGKRISIIVPAGLDISALSPTIILSEGAQVSPQSEVKQDFSREVVYTVTAEDGSTQEYRVKVIPVAGMGQEITSFKFPSVNANVDIDHSARKIKVVVPAGTNVTELAPVVLISDGARITPASGERQDFTKPVVYSVTGTNGSIRRYTVSVEVEVGAGKEITAFRFNSFDPAVVGVIDQNKHEVMVVVPKGTDLKKLTPTISVSPAAKISPASGEEQDFSAPFTYTVRAENRTAQDYVVTVKEFVRSEKAINEFSFNQDDPYPYGRIDETAHKIRIEVPTKMDLSAIKPRILISAGATISPASNVAQNFNNPVIYTVTAEDGSTQQYTVEAVHVKSRENRVERFYVKLFKKTIYAFIDSQAKTISLDFPPGTDISYLTPVFTVSPLAQVTPASNVSQDFTKPLVYTVTAEDGSTREYRVVSKVLKSEENDMTGFKISSLNPEVVGKIDMDKGTVSVVVPMGTDVTSLVPTISVSDRASVTPASGLTQNFINPLVYTVIAENGDKKMFTVTVEVAQSSANKITGFKLPDFKPEIIGEIDQQNNTINLTVPYKTSLSNLRTEVTISPRATVNPKKGAVVDFTSPVTYCVTAENQSNNYYKVTVSKEKNSEAQILSFNLESPKVAGVIDRENRRITMHVPYATDISSLVTSIKISEKAAISPREGSRTDFRTPVTYTVTSESGLTETYTAEVIVDPFNTVINGLSTTAIERKSDLTIKGIFYSKDVKVFLEGDATQELIVRRAYDDEIRVYVPEGTPFGTYRLSVISGGSKATYGGSVLVGKFAVSPSINSLATRWVTPGSTLIIYGSSLTQTGFTTEVEIDGIPNIKNVVSNSDGSELRVPIPANISEGTKYLTVVCSGARSNRVAFDVGSTPPPPKINKLSATSITAGDDFTISGVYFDDRYNQVWFEDENGEKSSVEIAKENSDEIQVKTYNLIGEKSYTVVVKTKNGTNSSSDKVKVRTGTSNITGFYPNVVGKDEVITVKGEYIYPHTYDVEIGGMRCQTSFKNINEMYVSLPFNISSGTYDLKVISIDKYGKQMGTAYSGRIKVK